MLKNLNTAACRLRRRVRHRRRQTTRRALDIGGGYQRIGEMIRITARVIEVRSGAIVQDRKDRRQDFGDLRPPGQDRLRVDQGLNVQLDTSELTEIERDETQSVEAYENFSRGMVNLRTGSRDTLDRAIYYFEKAIELRPELCAGVGRARRGL